jgi:dienelactone hydrolase
MSVPYVLIATDVFGATPAIANLVRQLAVPCLVISPFTEERSVSNEQQAYQRFLSEGGLHAYTQKITEALQLQCQTVQHVIGFSSGASALWLACAKQAYDLVSANLFYGARIRDFKELQPQCPTNLIFSERDVGYQPSELVMELKQLGHHAEIAKGTAHGFMNPYSAGFSLKKQTYYENRLIAQVHEKNRLYLMQA